MISYLFKTKLYDEVWDKTDNRIISRFDGKSGISFRLPNGNKIGINTRSLYLDGNTVAFSISADVAAVGGVSGVNEDGNPFLVVIKI